MALFLAQSSAQPMEDSLAAQVDSNAKMAGDAYQAPPKSLSQHCRRHAAPTGALLNQRACSTCKTAQDPYAEAKTLATWRSEGCDSLASESTCFAASEGFLSEASCDGSPSPANTLDSLSEHSSKSPANTLDSLSEHSSKSGGGSDASSVQSLPCLEEEEGAVCQDLNAASALADLEATSRQLALSAREAFLGKLSRNAARGEKAPRASVAGFPSLMASQPQAGCGWQSSAGAIAAAAAAEWPALLGSSGGGWATAAEGGLAEEAAAQEDAPEAKRPPAVGSSSGKPPAGGSGEGEEKEAESPGSAARAHFMERRGRISRRR